MRHLRQLTQAAALTVLIVEHAKCSPYVELGAIAFDVVDGRVPVTITGRVNRWRRGDYLIRYRAIDQAGNEAEVNKIVRVD